MFADKRIAMCRPQDALLDFKHFTKKCLGFTASVLSLRPDRNCSARHTYKRQGMFRAQYPLANRNHFTEQCFRRNVAILHSKRTRKIILRAQR